MARRVASPAASDIEVDVSRFLIQDPEDLSRESTPIKDDSGDRQKHHGNEIDLDDSAFEDEYVIAEQQAASNRKSSNLKGRTVRKGGGFQAFGLNLNLLKAVTRKGFTVPTPIQRKTIPLLLSGKDVVGMARTGSGKTAAFVIPLIEKLKMHSTKVGARALILCPSRELALQSLQVVKEFAKATDLRCVLLVGGDGLEDQFSALTSNPDILIATPGRFLHLKVEMQLDLSSITYVVFDEADRLFEMGFAPQLSEILHALPGSRQTMLFSATLPKSLVEFARAGLQDPLLVRLDADSKLSADLQSAFFTVKSAEKEGALLHLLQDVIHVPARTEVSNASLSSPTPASKKRKRPGNEPGSASNSSLGQHSTIIFAATKHHVEYLAQFLRLAGYSVSYIYGSLDQTARKQQIQAFRVGSSSILVVTDVAARGIDIPILGNVINYDFPSQPKIFIHRVGRTARAGHKGWSYTVVQDSDAPYLLDLQLFLGRKLRVGSDTDSKVDFAREIVVGHFQRDALQSCCEWSAHLLSMNPDLASLRAVAEKGEKQYLRSRNAASSESAKRAKQLVASANWSEIHPMFLREDGRDEMRRQEMLARLGGFRPSESIFEIGPRRGGKRGNEEAIGAIRQIRKGFDNRKDRLQAKRAVDNHDDEIQPRKKPTNRHIAPEDVSSSSDSPAEGDLQVTFSQPERSEPRLDDAGEENIANMFRDTENFMSYAPADQSLRDDRAYGVHSGSNTNFTEAARGATMDLALDESSRGFGEARGIMRWDKRHKKYVARQNDEDGSKGRKLVRGESGAKIAASFRSGRYDTWRKAHRLGSLKVGESEGKAGHGSQVPGKRYRHQSQKAPKAADKHRDDYEKKVKQVNAAKERTQGSAGKRELRSVDDIRKQRRLKEKRRAKNARPSKKTLRR